MNDSIHSGGGDDDKDDGRTMIEMKKMGMIVTKVKVTTAVGMVMRAWRCGWDGGDHGEGDGVGVGREQDWRWGW